MHFLLSPLAVSYIGSALAIGSAGCGKPHNSGYHGPNADHSITSGGRSRVYGVWVPADYNSNPSSPRRLIFDFHGNNRSPDEQFENSQYDQNDAGKDYLVVYPAGVDNSWQSAPYAVGAQTPSTSDDVNDLGFVNDLLHHIKNNYCVEDQQVYASGKSNGGGFVDLLACSDVGNQFAAFSIAAGALYSEGNHGTACNKRRAIINAHGKADTVINYTGGSHSGWTTPNIRDWISTWARRDGCTNASPRVVQNDGYQRISYTRAGREDVVVHYALNDAGHCWPDRRLNNWDALKATYKNTCKSNVPAFTSRTLGFFARWDLGNAPS